MKKEDEQRQEEEKLRDEEIRERMKLKRFMDMQEQEEAKQESAPKKQKIEISKEEKMAQLTQIKELYKKLPSDVFSYSIEWDSIFEFDLIQKICKPWIAKKIKEYMGVEEPMMINIVLKLLNQKCSNSQLLSKIQNILDDASEEFVEKLWRVIVFEDMKIKAGITKK